MKSFFFRLFCHVLGVIFLLQASPGRAEETGPNISDIFITTSQTHLLLSCSIKNGFTEEMMAGVKNGIPITFTFLIELEKSVKNWPDSTLTEMTIEHTLTYDPRTQQYQVTLPEQSNGAVVTESPDKAMAAMTELNGVRIISIRELEPDAPYALHVHATLAKKTLPLNMHYLVPFISLWDFETETRTIEFRY
ncbi:MAG: DUF4390 domain-containing protein [Desulfobulbaceae bacterium]